MMEGLMINLTEIMRVKISNFMLDVWSFLNPIFYSFFS